MNKVFDALLASTISPVSRPSEDRTKEYALRSNIHTKDIERTVDFRRCFLPGRRVEMSMVFEDSRL